MKTINYFNYSPELVRQAINNDAKFYPPLIALSKGNISHKLYDQYKNYLPKMINNTQLNMLRAYNFSIVDLGLYLDTHPDDEDALHLYRDLLMKYRNEVEKFEKSNYPLTISSDNKVVTNWTWINNWEVKGGKK